jgi:hypothetical protein
LPLSESFARAAAAAFDPLSPWSGTENVGPLLYWLVRVGRWETVAEFGTGLSTLYLARALADNWDDVVAHRRGLARRAAERREALRALEREPIWAEEEPDVEELTARVVEALVGAGRAEQLQPLPDLAYYAVARPPRLDSFEAEPEDAEYVARLRTALAEPGLDALVTLHPGAAIDGYLEAVPADRLPIGFGWNDFGNKLKFFAETFPHLDPAGGVFATHSPFDLAGEVGEIRRRLAPELAAGSCECLTLREPHKLMQNGCFLVRRCPPPTLPASHRDAMRALVEGLLGLATPA